ncbi:MAG TPA: hypothetical protein VHG28_22440, partial [Longimicrobiaceae bacterium]|nr:hypothetical protein [Longimicrobiaceae bacterium]
DPLPLREVEPGDSVRVEGAVERGYVVASRITGPREPAPREGEDPEPRPVEDAAPPEPAPDDDPAPREEDRGGDDREGGEAPRVERDSGEPAAAPERGRGRGKGRGEERGRGKGGEKKGKG